jgi:hypothetical protein
MRRRAFMTILAGTSTCLLVPRSVRAQALAPGVVVVAALPGQYSGSTMARWAHGGRIRRLGARHGRAL